jgi:hypothetical protein
MKLNLNPSKVQFFYDIPYTNILITKQMWQPQLEFPSVWTGHDTDQSRERLITG